ncbi:MAG TPA: hypothetical protein P5554_11760 [Spirochaetota bacterium]|nr:hypothetical protein [Spirochaetota bacterium]
MDSWVIVSCETKFTFTASELVNMSTKLSISSSKTEGIINKLKELSARG